MAASFLTGLIVWLGGPDNSNPGGYMLAAAGILIGFALLRHAYVGDIRAARRAQAQHAAVARLGQLALEDVGVEGLMEEALGMLESTLSARLALVHKSIPGDESLTVAAARGWPGHGRGRHRFPGGRSSMAGFALLSGHPVVVEDWLAESRFAAPPVVQQLGIRSGAAVLLEGHEASFGALAVHWTTTRRTSAAEIGYLQAIAHVLATTLDRERADEERRIEALHDLTTGLPNRTLLDDRLDFVLGRGGVPAVLRLDIDRFKLVNDSHGHSVGDELLAGVAARLRDSVSAGNTVARVGGDEFAVLIHDSESVETAVSVAERIAAAFTKPLIAGESEQFVTVSIGLAIASRTVRAEQLMRNAYTAMYRAKELGGARYEIYDEGLRARTLERLRLEGDLRRAVERRELSLVYQPIVSLPDGRMEGVEALLRWEHPVRGSVSPAEFIPVAEQSGLIEQIGDWVLRESLSQSADWHAANPDRRPLEMSVNLSARELAVRGAVGRIRDTIARSGVDPSSISLEITESTLLDGVDDPDAVLRDLGSIGVKLWLDDFGTGYSSLGYLSRFKLDALKVDRSFVEKLGSSPEAGAIVRAVVAMAGSLGLEVVAEGVETRAQLEQLKELGCSNAQGYLLGRPMSPASVGALLARNVPLTDALAS